MKNLQKQWVLLFAFWSSLGWGQLTVELTLDQKQFLSGEPIPAVVRVTNHSGKDLAFGDLREWLDISVEVIDGSAVSKGSEFPSAKPFTLETAYTKALHIDLAAAYQFLGPGRYWVEAQAKSVEYGLEAASKRVMLEIAAGTRLWEQEVGVPGKGALDLRKFILVVAPGPRQSRLFVRITDPKENEQVKLVALGPIVSFGHPELMVDSLSRLHVLHQFSAKLFQYCVLDGNGKVLRRQTYEYAGVKPKLETADDGTIRVKGPVRHASDYDIDLLKGAAEPKERQ